MRERERFSIEKGPFYGYPTCLRLTDCVEAGHDSRGMVQSESFTFFENGLIRPELL